MTHSYTVQIYRFEILRTDAFSGILYFPKTLKEQKRNC